MARFLLVVAGTGFWLVVAAQGFHMAPLWVVISTALALVALLGGSLLVVPSTYKPALPGGPAPVSGAPSSGTRAPSP